MAGLYLHIPFCKRKCNYCDFYSVANLSYLNDFKIRLLQEINERKHLFSKKTINTIYFGGGTPSLMDIEFYEKIMGKIFSEFKIDKSPEITIEINPENAEKSYLKKLYEIGFNRISIGTQSFVDDVLKTLSRRHTAKDSLLSIEKAFESGFVNISIDLIYGVPGLLNDDFEREILLLQNLPVTHLSAYHLSIEEGTLLSLKKQKGVFSEVDEKTGFEQYQTLIKTANFCGFKQYEISNFAKNGLISKHNSAYWNRNEYLGLGPGANSFVDNIRYICAPDIKKYLLEFEYSQDILTESDRINETIMLNLRTVKGLDTLKFKQEFGEKELKRLEKELKKIKPEFYVYNSGFIRLTDKGMFISDYIISKLFV